MDFPDDKKLGCGITYGPIDWKKGACDPLPGYPHLTPGGPVPDELTKRIHEAIDKAEKESALNKQIGGDHYKKMKIQPMEFSMANGLDACQHTAIKYITRFRDKGGIADLEKAIHVIQMLIEFEKKAK